MSDTIPCVRWSLGSGKPRLLLGGRGWEWNDQLLWAAIERTGLESEFRHAFQMTRPLWYGFWIDSPLSQRQCALLFALFSDLAAQQRLIRADLHAFLPALQRAAETDEPLQATLLPPGHVDLNMSTTFAHCPRCKAEGPCPRWQEAYPTEPVPCRVCGATYSPADTYSSEPDYFDKTVSCCDCRHSYPLKSLSESEIAILENEHYYQEARLELAWLRRVAAFYARHPESRGEVKPHFERVLESSDALVREQLFSGVPFSEIELPHPDTSHQAWTDEDREVVGYLQTNSFNLEARLQWVQHSLFERAPAVFKESVRCPQCGGRITVLSEESL